MSYDISLLDPITKKIVEFEQPHCRKGGTYQAGGTCEAWLNVTYNYSKHYRKVFGDKGIRTIYGMTGEDSIPILEKAISLLGNDVADNYWEPTEGNAKKALYDLLTFAQLKPDGVWDGD